MVSNKIAGNRKSSSRTKNNSFYTTNYRKNNYLERHPEAIRTSKFFAGVGTTANTSQPRAILSPAIPSLYPSQIIPADQQKYYVITETTTVDLAAQSYEELVNEAEDGEILAIEAVTSSPLITVEIVIYGVGNSPNIINDYSINKMVSLGRGLTPGDVEILPGGRSKDTTGLPLQYYPYVARYKSDTLVDFMLESRQTYVFRYEPSVPLTYSSIIINVKNTSTESNKTVDSVNIHRRVYENPFADNLVGRPIESYELFKQQQQQQQQEQIPTAPINPNESPYITNYLQRQKELQELANQPEVLPDDIY